MVWEFLRRVLGPGYHLSPIDYPRWSQQLDQARDLMDAFEYHEADDLLTALCQDILPVTSSTVGNYLAAALAAHGECLFHLGRIDRAHKVTLDAQRRMQPTGDPELQIQLWGNLLEIHRYTGQQDEAAECAEQLAILHDAEGQPEQAEHCRRQAALLRQGEPRLRVVIDLDGRRCEIDEVLAGQSGAVRFVYARDRLTLRHAEALTRTGEALSHQGRFDEALAILAEASTVDPHAPEPVYQSAHVHTYRSAFEQARDGFRRVETLAPGWFHVRSALWWIEELLAGRLSLDSFRVWHMAAEAPLPVDAKIQLLDQALIQTPDVPHLHAQRGRLLRERGLGVAAEKACRRGLALAPTPDVETRLCVDLAAVVDNREERHGLLRRAIELNADLVATATARIVLHFD